MHNEREENSITRPRETERLNGKLEIDYQRNRVMFHPNALCELTFSLPLTPSDVDVVRSLAQITRRLETDSFRDYRGGNQAAACNEHPLASAISPRTNSGQ
jgi:hypothetical protein